MKNIQMAGVDTSDYPDFCDAYLEYAEHDDGTPYTDLELDTFCDENPEKIHALAMESLI